MKPKRIILIRHGESQANVDRYLFGRVPDYTIELTDKGHEQAREAWHLLSREPNLSMAKNLGCGSRNGAICGDRMSLTRFVRRDANMAHSTIRLFVMRFFHLTVEEFERMIAPKNCDLVVLELQDDGHYRLITEMACSSEPLRYARPIKL